MAKTAQRDEQLVSSTEPKNLELTHPLAQEPSLKQPQNQTLEQAQKQVQEQTQKQAQKQTIYQRALSLLAQREHSRQELFQKLQQKACITSDDSVFHAVLDRLQCEGYQSDQRFAESFIRSRVSRGQGQRKIHYDLQRCGIDNTFSQAVLQQVEQTLAIDWLALAEQQRAKRFGENLPETFKERQKQARFLQGRGFEYEIIQAVFGT
jgi:regulatory protein